MKKASFMLFILMLLFLAACSPQPSMAIVPPETLAAQTLEALAPSILTEITPAPTKTPTLTSTIDPVRSAVGSGCIPPGAPRQTGRVTNVINGDTIEVAIDNETHIVKYIGVDAPDLMGESAPLGPEAMGINQKIVGGQVVILVQDQTAMTSNGILPRYVFVNNTFVNYEILTHGFAKAVSELPNTSCDLTFQGAQANAQAALLGVWAPTPLPSATSTVLSTSTVLPSPTLIPVCNCKGNLTCKNFKNQSSAQACLNYCKAVGLEEYLWIDKNHNGIACEGMN